MKSKNKLALEKLKKLKKGEVINFNTGKYKVEKFDVVSSEKDDGSVEKSKDIVLTRVGENPKVLLQQKYVLRDNEKTKEAHLFKLEQGKEKFPGGFKFEQRGVWTSYKEEKI